MIIKRVPLSEVEVWDKNPRNIKTKDFERLKRQIQELGVYKPLICVKENGKYTTLGGNMRLRALVALNYKELDISLVNAPDEATKIKYALSDNDRVGGYDEQALAELAYPHIEEINLDDYKLDIGEPISLKDVIEDYAPDIDGEDEVPEIDDSPAITKMGDLFTLGKHRLLCGDATKEEDVKRLMGGKKADMVFTDPPYNINYEYESYEDNKDIGEYKEFCKKFFKLLNENSKKNIIITSGHQNLNIWYLLESPRGIAIWVKKNSVNGGRVSHLTVWEPILFFGQFKRNSRANDLYEVNLWHQKDVGKSHTCPKPITLIEDLIKSYSEIDDLWLDVFLGSGTTMIACEKLNRICYGMEIEPKYCDVIITRYANFTETPEEEIRATRE